MSSNNNHHQILSIIEKYRLGKATQQEIQLLDQWYDSFSEDELYTEGMSVAEKLTAKEKHLQGVNKQVYREAIPHRKTKTYRLWPRISVAAAILLVLGSGFFFYTSYFAPRHLEGSTATRDLLANDIKPGSNKATLTLSDGSTITLTDAANGALAQQSGVQITKTANGQLIYSALSPSSSNHPASLAPPGRGGEAGEGGSNSKNSSLPSGISPQRGERGVALNIIKTPRGGQYQIRLPDGTQVWLNAGTTLRYPVSFAGQKERSVELSGEAYFEVFKDKAHPFRVHSRGQLVEVLGTHFNINSYADEVSTKTTLLEGSVKVTVLSLRPASLSPLGRGGEAGEGRGNTSLPSGISPQSGERGLGTILKPGEQASLKNNKITVTAVNANYAVTWKEGYFLFDNERLESIMEKLSLWYDVKVIYEDVSLKRETIVGTSSRAEDISKVLNMIARAKVVKFRVEGNTVFVERNLKNQLKTN